MFKSRIIMFSLISIITTNIFAGALFSEWGMKPDIFMAAETKKIKDKHYVKHIQSTNEWMRADIKSCNKPNSINIRGCMISGTYNFGTFGKDMQVIYFFRAENGRTPILYAINLNPNKEWNSVELQLAYDEFYNFYIGKYGKSIKNIPNSVSSYYAWQDQKKGNVIKLQSYGLQDYTDYISNFTVSYRPMPGGDSEL